MAARHVTGLYIRATCINKFDNRFKYHLCIPRAAETSVENTLLARDHEDRMLIKMKFLGSSRCHGLKRVIFAPVITWPSDGSFMELDVTGFLNRREKLECRCAPVRDLLVMRSVKDKNCLLVNDFIPLEACAAQEPSPKRVERC